MGSGAPIWLFLSSDSDSTRRDLPSFSLNFSISCLWGGHQDIPPGFCQVFTLGISKIQKEKPTRNLPEKIRKTYTNPMKMSFIIFFKLFLNYNMSSSHRIICCSQSDWLICNCLFFGEASGRCVLSVLTCFSKSSLSIFRVNVRSRR